MASDTCWCRTGDLLPPPPITVNWYQEGGHLETQGSFSINSDNEFFVEVLFKQNMEANDVEKVQWMRKEDIVFGVLKSTWLWASAFS